MTCVVGFVTKNRIFMGADSLGSNAWDCVQRTDPKVFERTLENGHKMLFGFTSSYRMGQLLRYKLVIPFHDESIDDYEYLCTSFIDAVRYCLKDNGYTTVNNNTEKAGQFLIGYKDSLYLIDSDLQVAKFYDNYYAIGCGQAYALGSLASSSGVYTAEYIVNKALCAAEKYSNGVRGPMCILSIPVT